MLSRHVCLARQKARPVTFHHHHHHHHHHHLSFIRSSVEDRVDPGDPSGAPRGLNLSKKLGHSRARTRLGCVPKMGPQHQMQLHKPPSKGVCGHLQTNAIKRLAGTPSHWMACERIELLTPQPTTQPRLTRTTCHSRWHSMPRNLLERGRKDPAPAQGKRPATSLAAQK